MTTFSSILTTQDPNCCHRKTTRTRTGLEINLLENALYALYVLVMLGTFCLFNNTKGIYVCGALLVIILGNMYSLNRSISQNMYEGHELDTSGISDSDFEKEDEAQDEGDGDDQSSILEEFKKVVNEAYEENKVSDAVYSATTVLEKTATNYMTAITSADTAAVEYDRVAREYSEIEQIIQNVAAEYREKARAAREAAEARQAQQSDAAEAEAEAEAEARADAADEREYNED
jgi:hypothetical protein